jgi:hypothetical protein
MAISIAVFNDDSIIFILLFDFSFYTKYELNYIVDWWNHTLPVSAWVNY